MDKQADRSGVSFQDFEYRSMKIDTFTRSGQSVELKRIRGVRDPEYQSEILHGERPIWKDDRCIWEFSQLYVQVLVGSGIILEKDIGVSL